MSLPDCGDERTTPSGWLLRDPRLTPSVDGDGTRADGGGVPGPRRSHAAGDLPPAGRPGCARLRLRRGRSLWTLAADYLPSPADPTRGRVGHHRQARSVGLVCAG